MIKTVTLPSDGLPIEVRVLTLYELDGIPFNDPGEFLYDYQLSNGQVTQRPYTLADWREPPEKPATPKELCETGSYEWALWARYDLYEAVYQHRLKQIEAAETHAHDVARYVIRECLAEADRGRVRTPEDLETVAGAALVDEETEQGVSAALAATFPGLLGWVADLAGAPTATAG